MIDQPPLGPGTIDLLPPAIDLQEYEVSANLQLMRTNGTEGPATVELDSQDITAESGKKSLAGAGPNANALHTPPKKGGECFQSRIGNPLPLRSSIPPWQLAGSICFMLKFRGVEFTLADSNACRDPEDAPHPGNAGRCSGREGGWS